MLKRLISIVVTLSMIATLNLQAVYSDTSENTVPQQTNEMSQARQNYYSLIEGDYKGYEMKAKFEELFGTGYSNEEILNNYMTIFDIAESEVDDGLLELLTMEDTPPVEEPLDPLPEEPYLEQQDSIEMPEEVPILEEISSDDDTATGKSDDPSGHFPTPYSANGFTDITYVSKTNNSITFNIWYKSADINNILKIYDSYNKTWTNLLGRDGNPAANTRQYTATNLLPGAVYKFIATTYDRSTGTWKDSEITVQTSGLKTPSFTLVSKTTNSITVKAVFPSEYQWGNKIEYYDTATSAWIDATGQGLYSKSGTYTIRNLSVGQSYQLSFRYYDGLTNLWNDGIRLKVPLELPPEQLVRFEHSNMSFDIDQLLINELGTARTGRMLTNLNQAYDVMYGLVGGNKPNNGEKMTFKSDRTLPADIEGRSGYPILWKTTSALTHAAKMVALNVDNTEAPFHEIGHNFDSYRWNFDAEVQTYLKIYYYFSTTNQKMAIANQSMFFTGSQYKTYIKSHALRVNGKYCYDDSIPNGIYSPYGLAYNLVSIADRIGWEPFRQTYAHFNNMYSWEVPSRKIDKFNLFMTKLKDFSGTDVLALFNSNEIAVYEAELGGKIEYLEIFTKSEVEAFANYYLTQQTDTYRLWGFLRPLHDDSGKLFAYAIPYTNNATGQAGHINIGALKNGLAFYINDPIPENYTAIQEYSTSNQVKYQPPFLYYVDSATSTRSVKDDKVPFTQNPQYFNEENAAQNELILQMIQNPQLFSDEPGGGSGAPPNTHISALSAEKNGRLDYVRIQGEGFIYNNKGQLIDDRTKTYYGGYQAWWEYTTPAFVSKTGRSGGWLHERGCGVVALSDNILYQVGRHHQRLGGLLQYTEEPRYLNQIQVIPNDKFKLENFNKTFSVLFDAYGLSIRRQEYLKFLDFYADFTSLPTLTGSYPDHINGAYDTICSITGYNYTKSEPVNYSDSTVESFFKAQLDKDLPILMYNSFEYEGDTHYINTTQTFNTHWMTITKYFHSLATGDKFVAISSWGERYAVNCELMKVDELVINRYYSNFYTYEITQ